MLYYFRWRTLGVMWVYGAFLSLVELVGKFEVPAMVYWLPLSIVCAQIANYDYYRKVIHGEKIWNGFPHIFSKPSGAVGFPLIAMAMLFGVITLHPIPVPACHDGSATAGVKQLFEKELDDPFGSSSKGTITYAFEDIKTTFTDAETGANEYEAKLSLTASDTGYTEIIPITYIIEPSEEVGKFYVGLLDW